MNWIINFILRKYLDEIDDVNIELMSENLILSLELNKISKRVLKLEKIK